MLFPSSSSPYLHSGASVSKIMLRVCLALLPGIGVSVWFFGYGILINIGLSCMTALVCETLVLKLRQKPIIFFLSDLSALVTALLFAISLPPLTPWWITISGCAFAIVVAKHIFGGLGHNIFNPAMCGFAMVLVSFPKALAFWPRPDFMTLDKFNLSQVWHYISTGKLPAHIVYDSLSLATPFDHLYATQQGLVNKLMGSGMEWIALAYLIGGLWLWYKKIIQWQIPSMVLLSLTLMAVAFFIIDPHHYGSPLFHLFGGATMVGVFFIATDPVTAATTPWGKIIYGLGIGIFIYIIRVFSAYPDSVAFAVLLMNIAAPMIDRFCRPRVYGTRT